MTSSGPIFFWSKRVGINNKVFMMPKFRTMINGSPELATHLFHNANDFITPIGFLLRKTSLDELPQLWSILIGKMSFVGPRPALFNQYDLIAERQKFGIDKLKPGLTGLAQINGRNRITMNEKIYYEYIYVKEKSFILDLKIIFLTIFKIIN
jgi:O-antigen biosynthesis protein WbqP